MVSYILYPHLMLVSVGVLRVDGRGGEPPEAHVEDHGLLGFDWSPVRLRARQHVVADGQLLLVFEKTEGDHGRARLVALCKREEIWLNWTRRKFVEIKKCISCLPYMVRSLNNVERI